MIQETVRKLSFLQVSSSERANVHSSADVDSMEGPMRRVEQHQLAEFSTLKQDPGVSFSSRGALFGGVTWDDQSTSPQLLG